MIFWCLINKYLEKLELINNNIEYSIGISLITYKYNTNHNLNVKCEKYTKNKYMTNIFYIWIFNFINIWS